MKIRPAMLHYYYLLLLVGCLSVNPNTTIAAAAFSSASAPLPTTRRRAAAAAAALLTTTTTTTTRTFASKTEETESAARSKAVGRVIKQTAVLDGAEWVSVRNTLLRQHDEQKQQQQQKENDQQQSPPPPPPAYARTILGVYTAITGSVNGKRVVGMQVLNKDENGGVETNADSTMAAVMVTLDQDASIQLYKESVAHIPDAVSEPDAVWTLLQALSIVHCVRPVAWNVGGSGGSEFASRAGAKVVVLGGNDLAVTAATALSKLECQVTLVAAEKPGGLPAAVRHLTPASGGDGESGSLGFSTVLDKFDAVLDTLGDEQDDGPGVGSIVVKQLAEQNGCHIYVSAQTASQEIVVQNGLIWGPAKSKEHVVKLQARAAKATAAQFPSPVSFGATVQALLEQGVILAAPKEYRQKGGAEAAVFVRGWSLKDFWEYTTWPRNAASNVRFGFPGTDDMFYDNDDDEEEEDDGPMISAPPLRPGDVRPDMFMTPQQGDDVDADADNPYIVNIDDVKGLQRIVEDETTCLLFLSAPFCRTCRYLKPKYQRMARQYIDTASDKGVDLGMVFVKAEAGGAAGKELGRALGIDSVPSFVMFKKGRRYGTPLSVSRLPSKKLELAIDYLQQDKSWDVALFKDEQEGFEGGSGRGTSNRSKLL